MVHWLPVMVVNLVTQTLHTVKSVKHIISVNGFLVLMSFIASGHTSRVLSELHNPVKRKEMNHNKNNLPFSECNMMDLDAFPPPLPVL